MYEKIADEIGFESVAMLLTSELPVTPEFRKYCEENLCGKYGVNYACPPDCGTTDQMKEKLLSKSHAVVLKTVWEMDYRDAKLVRENKGKHNKMVREFIKRMPAENQNGFMIAASGCGICDVCAIVDNKPCRFPDLMASCVSAYCINVAELCKKLEWSYFEENKVCFFGMYVFDKKD